MSADAGVGASMASGSHTWEKNCAALIVPEMDNESENNVKKWTAVLPKKSNEKLKTEFV
jgi:hypothetical protein